MFCGHCGENLGNDKRFCPKCGTPCGGTHTQPPFTPTDSKQPKRRRQTTIIAVICLALILISVVISGTSGGYHKQILGDWYLEGENIPTFTLYKDGTCLIAQDGRNSVSQDAFFKGTWFLTGIGPGAMPGNKLALSAPGMEPWSCGVLSIDREKMVVGRNPWVDRNDPENITYWRTPHC